MVDLTLCHWRSSLHLFAFSILILSMYHGAAGLRVTKSFLRGACWSKIDRRVSSYRDVRYAEMYPECVIASWDPLVFLLYAQNIEQRVQLDTEKKIECWCKLQTPAKTCERHISQGNWTFSFLTMEKWSSSLNFKVNFYFRIFVVEWLHFEFPHVAWHVLSCFLGETIGDTFNLPMTIKHFSRSSVCCMLCCINFKYWFLYLERNDRESNGEVC